MFIIIANGKYLGNCGGRLEGLVHISLFLSIYINYQNLKRRKMRNVIEFLVVVTYYSWNLRNLGIGNQVRCFSLSMFFFLPFAMEIELKHFCMSHLKLLQMLVPGTYNLPGFFGVKINCYMLYFQKYLDFCTFTSDFLYVFSYF